MTSEEFSLFIKEAVPDDAKDLLKFLEEVKEDFSNFGFVENIDQSIPAQKISLDNLYYSNNNTLILALVSNTIVGLVSISGGRDKMTNHIGELGIVVDESYRNLGIGTFLIEEALIWAKENSAVKRIELRVQKRNTQAVHLYKKMEFKKEAVIERGAKIGEDLLDVIQMSYLI